jgi:predicted small lipoprotein YifL
MKKIISSLISIIALLLIAACSTKNPSPQVLPGGNGTTIPQDSTNVGSIDPSGTNIPAGADDGTPGSSEASQTGGDEMNTPANWLTYLDPKFGFSISYPDAYVLLPEAELPKDGAPGLVHRVRFLNSDLAKSDTANLQPPDFSIALFENPSAIPLNTWVDANAPKGSTEEIKLNDVSCLKVTMTTLMAPNQFYFCAWNSYIYQFTPLGQYAEDMLKSFKFGR